MGSISGANPARTRSAARQIHGRQQRMNRIVALHPTDRLPRTEALRLGPLGRAQRPHPVVYHRSLRDAPLLCALLEAIDVATGQEDLARRALRIAVALQRHE